MVRDELSKSKGAESSARDASPEVKPSDMGRTLRGNVGVLLGATSARLADIDVDPDEIEE